MSWIGAYDPYKYMPQSNTGNIVSQVGSAVMTLGPQLVSAVSAAKDSRVKTEAVYEKFKGVAEELNANGIEWAPPQPYNKRLDEVDLKDYITEAQNSLTAVMEQSPAAAEVFNKIAQRMPNIQDNQRWVGASKTAKAQDYLGSRIEGGESIEFDAPARTGASVLPPPEGLLSVPQPTSDQPESISGAGGTGFPPQDIGFTRPSTGGPALLQQPPSPIADQAGIEQPQPQAAPQGTLGSVSRETVDPNEDAIAAANYAAELRSKISAGLIDGDAATKMMLLHDEETRKNRIESDKSLIDDMAKRYATFGKGSLGIGMFETEVRTEIKKIDNQIKNIKKLGKLLESDPQNPKAEAMALNMRIPADPVAIQNAISTLEDRKADFTRRAEVALESIRLMEAPDPLEQEEKELKVRKLAAEVSDKERGRDAPVAAPVVFAQRRLTDARDDVAKAENSKRLYAGLYRQAVSARGDKSIADNLIAEARGIDAQAPTEISALKTWLKTRVGDAENALSDAKQRVATAESIYAEVRRGTPGDEFSRVSLDAEEREKIDAARNIFLNKWPTPQNAFAGAENREQLVVNHLVNSGVEGHIAKMVYQELVGGGVGGSYGGGSGGELSAEDQEIIQWLSSQDPPMPTTQANIEWVRSQVR